MLPHLIPIMVAFSIALTIPAGPAWAQRFDDRGRERHERWERDHWERRHGYGRPYLRPGYYAPPPVYYTPPLRPYYAPRPFYTPPGFGPFVPFR